MAAIGDTDNSMDILLRCTIRLHPANTDTHRNKLRNIHKLPVDVQRIILPSHVVQQDDNRTIPTHTRTETIRKKGKQKLHQMDNYRMHNSTVHPRNPGDVHDTVLHNTNHIHGHILHDAPAGIRCILPAWMVSYYISIIKEKQIHIICIGAYGTSDSYTGTAVLFNPNTGDKILRTFRS